MISSKFWQVSSDSSLEYQQGVAWLQMACKGSKMAKKKAKHNDPKRLILKNPHVVLLIF